MVDIWKVNLFFFLLMFENGVGTASSFSLNDGVSILQYAFPVLPFSFLNPHFSIFSSTLFGFLFFFCLACRENEGKQSKVLDLCLIFLLQPCFDLFFFLDFV